LTPGARSRPRQELVDDAIERARRGLPVGELPDEIREQLTDSMIAELLADARGEILGPGGLLADLTRRLVERAMAAELTEHLGYQPHGRADALTGLVTDQHLAVFDSDVGDRRPPPASCVRGRCQTPGATLELQRLL